MNKFVVYDNGRPLDGSFITFADAYDHAYEYLGPDDAACLTHFVAMRDRMMRYGEIAKWKYSREGDMIEIRKDG